MKDTKSLKVLLIALCVGVVGLAVGYASLSTQLSVTASKVTLSAQTWDVGFVTGDVTGTATTTSDTGFSCGTATVEAESVSVAATNLSKPDDRCVYPLTIQNTGTIDATISSISLTNPDSTVCTQSGASMVCGNITYKITTDNKYTTLLTTSTVLNKTNGSLPVYLVVEYTGTSLVETEVNQENAKFTITYAQK